MLTLTKVYKKDPRKFISIRRIAVRDEIPREFLEKIFSQLSKAGFTTSQQGSKGGVKLNKNPRKISVADLIREIDGPLAPVSSVSKVQYAPSPIERSKNLIFLFKRLRDIQNKILSNTTFEDLV